jgi:pimeloyl-ACP methyl ester carboxylesterase
MIKVGEYEGENIYIKTVLIDYKNIRKKPLLIFCHGYAASSVLYFQIYKRLLKLFCIITFDHIGMGASSRPDDFHHQ